VLFVPIFVCEMGDWVLSVFVLSILICNTDTRKLIVAKNHVQNGVASEGRDDSNDKYY
jgi:hypothetical protein